MEAVSRLALYPGIHLFESTYPRIAAAKGAKWLEMCLHLPSQDPEVGECLNHGPVQGVRIERPLALGEVSRNQTHNLYPKTLPQVSPVLSISQPL